MNCYIIRYGELALKGDNRYDFEKMLVENIKRSLKSKKIAFDKVLRKPGRLYLYGNEDYGVIKYVFGVTSISKATEIIFDIEKIKNEIEKQLKDKKFTTFRITANRIDNSVNINSMKLNEILGEFVLETFKNKKVSLKQHDLEVFVEINDKKAYVSTEKISAVGGLPIGTSSNVLCLLEDEYSLLASFLLMRRGCNCVFISKDKINIGLLKKYYFDGKLNVLTLKHDEFDKIAENNNCEALVVNDVIDNIKNYDASLIILRPLVGFTKKEMDEKLKWMKDF